MTLAAKQAVGSVSHALVPGGVRRTMPAPLPVLLLARPKELALSDIHRPLYPGEPGEAAVEAFRFGDVAGWTIRG